MSGQGESYETEDQRARTGVFSRQREETLIGCSVLSTEAGRAHDVSHFLSGSLNSELCRGAQLCYFNWVYWAKQNAHECKYSMQTYCLHLVKNKGIKNFFCLPRGKEHLG